MGFFRLVFAFLQFAVSVPFGVHPSVHPRSPPPGEYACVPSFPLRPESARKSRAPPPQTPPAPPASASDFLTPCLLGHRSNFRATSTRCWHSWVGVLFQPPGSVNPAKVCCGHRVTP